MKEMKAAERPAGCLFVVEPSGGAMQEEKKELKPRPQAGRGGGG